MSTQPTSDVWVPSPKIEQIFPEITATSNAPTAGPRVERELPKGSAPIQLYAIGTPNGKKLGIMLEELGIEYDAHIIHIGKGDQFTSGYIELNPNGKIPSIIDNDGPDGSPIGIFESGSELLYLADKYKRFIPSDPRLRVQVTSWLFWQVGGLGPTVGTFNHFFIYAPADKIEVRTYGVSRYGMDTLRHLDVLERHLAAGRTYMVGEEYSIADIAIFPWVDSIRNTKHSSGLASAEYLSFDRFKNVIAWLDRIGERPAVKRGLTVCNFSGVAKPWLVTEDKK